MPNDGFTPEQLLALEHSAIDAAHEVVGRFDETEKGGDGAELASAIETLRAALIAIARVHQHVSLGARAMKPGPKPKLKPGPKPKVEQLRVRYVELVIEMGTDHAGELLARMRQALQGLQ